MRVGGNSSDQPRSARSARRKSFFSEKKTPFARCAPWLIVSATLLVAWPVVAADLIGSVACRTCHAEAYKVWSQSAHARAASTLGENRKTALCLQCHSRDEQRSGQAAVEGVSCETCHGGGRYYEVAVVMKDKELARLFGLVDPTPQS